MNQKDKGGVGGGGDGRSFRGFSRLFSCRKNHCSTRQTPYDAKSGPKIVRARKGGSGGGREREREEAEEAVEEASERGSRNLWLRVGFYFCGKVLTSIQEELDRD